MPVGYVSKGSDASRIRPGGNFTACVDRARALLGLRDPCPHERCGVKGSYLPPAIRGEMLATENFFYTARFLGLPERATIAQMAGAGERVCGAEWRSLVAAHLGANRAARGEGEDETFEEDESSLARYCFSSSLIVAALSHGLKLPAQAKIRFSNSVGGKAVDWAMGAAIAFTAAAVERKEEWLLGSGVRWKDAFGDGVGFDWRILVLVFAVLVLVLVGLASRRSRRARAVERRIRAKLQAWGSAGRLTRSEGTFGSLTSFMGPAKDH